jgi:hypothetical protein
MFFSLSLAPRLVLFALSAPYFLAPVEGLPDGAKTCGTLLCACALDAIAWFDIVVFGACLARTGRDAAHGGDGGNAVRR